MQTALIGLAVVIAIVAAYYFYQKRSSFTPDTPRPNYPPPPPKVQSIFNVAPLKERLPDLEKNVWKQRAPKTDHNKQMIDSVMDPDSRSRQEDFTQKYGPVAALVPVVDDLDEATYLDARQGWGINAFQTGAPSQGLHSYNLPEVGEELFSKFSTKFEPSFTAPNVR